MLARIRHFIALPGWPWLPAVRPVVIWTLPFAGFVLAVQVFRRDPATVDSLFILVCVALTVICFDRARAHFEAGEQGYIGNLVMGWVFTVLFTLVCLIHLATWFFLLVGVMGIGR